MNMRALLLAGAAMAAFLVLHLIVWRVTRRRHGVMTLVALAGIVGAIVAVSALWLRGATLVPALWTAVPVYACAVMAYLHWYVGIVRSVSVRIMGELLLASTHTLARSALAERYAPEGMVAHRLETLADHGWLTRDGAAYVVTPRGARLARADRFFVRLYALRQTG